MVERSELAAVEAFEVLSIDDGKAVVRALQHRQFGIVRFTYAARVPSSQLPAGAGVGSVIEPDPASGWSLSDVPGGDAWRSLRAQQGGRRA